MQKHDIQAHVHYTVQHKNEEKVPHVFFTCKFKRIHTHVSLGTNIQGVFFIQSHHTSWRIQRQKRCTPVHRPKFMHSYSRSYPCSRFWNARIISYMMEQQLCFLKKHLFGHILRRKFDHWELWPRLIIRWKEENQVKHTYVSSEYALASYVLRKKMSLLKLNEYIIPFSGHMNYSNHPTQ